MHLLSNTESRLVFLVSKYSIVFSLFMKENKRYVTIDPKCENTVRNTKPELKSLVGWRCAVLNSVSTHSQ